ncbi:unnamed protein product, partial [Cladocopium goreaui]
MSLNPFTNCSRRSCPFEAQTPELLPVKTEKAAACYVDEVRRTEGYEPKRFTGQMSEFHRRRATKEEMEQGQKEIRLADERMKTEAESRGEMPIQNGPEEKPEDVVEGETSPPKEGKRDEPQRGTPARNSNQGSGAKALLPPTQPPPDPPALSLRQEVVNSLEKNTPADKGEGNFNGGPLMREIATPPEQQAGDDATQVQGQSMAPPLFTEEQLRNFAALQGQAAWMYGPQQSFFNPIGFSRPSFLDGDAARASVSQHERDMEFLRMQAVRDREEKDECRRQIQLLVEENRQLRARFESASKMQTEDEPRFATPEEQPDQTSPGFDMDVDWLKRRKEADRPPSKEADRPPSKEADRPPSKEADRPPSKEAARPPFLPEAAEFKTPKEAARPPKVEASQRPQEEGSRGAPGGGNAQFTEKSLEFMVIMMETMKDLHKKVNETKDGPLQLGDWLLTVEPIIADLSATSEVWWSLMVKSAEQWYQKHMMMPPLDRVQHEVQPPPEVTLEKWSRLERRTASMLLQSVPEVVKEELVSARRLSVFGILTQLLLTYCPGGVLEKQTLLRSLEEPTEVTTVGEAPAAIRRWLRWKLRSQEIGAVTPDPALLLKGLNKLTRRVLESNKELQFRVSLARNSLGVDTRPTDTTVSQFATHLLAEIEQVALSEKRATAAMPKSEVKIKYLDADKNKPKTKERPTEEDKPKPKCRFFLTDAGCKRGKECTFSHDVKDDRRRCYNCGSVDHLSPSCTRSKGASTETSPNKPRVAKAEGEERNVTSPMKESETGSQSSQGEAVKDLLEEANRMLKSLSSSSNTTASTTSSTSEEERKDVMERLHQQLKSMKTFKMKRLNVGNDVGLVDSGATHPLRPRHEGENVDLYPVVEVALADGRTVRLKMSPGGAMISPSPAIEPIIPMGLLSQKLNCDISWKQGSMQIHHPLRGEIKVMMKGSCPHVARSEALTLIAELEDIKMGIPNEIGSFDAEVAWLRKLVSQHPVLSSLPEHIKERLVVEPGTWSDLPGNRHSRKRWKRSGLAVHLYAGPETGFTLRHAIKQLGGSVDALLEVDVQRGEQHDMLSDHAVYRGLFHTGEIVEYARYFLVGVLTWRVPKGSDKMQNPSEEAASEGAPEIEEGAEDPNPPGEDGLEAEELLPAQLPGEAPAEGEPGDAPGEDGLEGQADLPVQLPGEAFGPPNLDEVTELRRFRMALPMGSKKARDVVNTVMEFVLRLRTEGFHVGRIHSDQGHEFAGEFKTWARQRGIYLTKTPGDDPAANGRAEMAVKDFKNQIRRTLRQASEDAKWWPWALRYVNEVYRCVRMETRPSWPRFLEEVRVRKRTWRRDDLDPRVEKVQYLCPSVENHGHWVIKEGEAPRLTRYILAPTIEPEDETVWIAVEREGRDAQEQRRRIRGRSAVRRMDASVADPEEVLEEKEKAEVQRLMKVVEDEMQSIINDDPDLAAEEVRILGRLRKMAEVKEDGDESEVESLTIEKAALKELSKDEVKALKKKAEKEGKKLEIIPSKLVFTVKPSPDHKEGKKKTRWVVCGNYEEKKEGEENYSGGADATSLRLLAWIASRMKWAGCILDVRTAFLNAQMEQEPDEDLLLVQPPHILKEMKFLDPDTLYLPLKAVYGFRRSPKLWGLHRDKTIKTFDIKVVIDGRCESLELKPMESEQNLWKVVVVRGGFQEAEEEWISNGRVIGLVMTYVDDIFIVAEKQVAKSVAQKFQETWATTQPEWVGETPVRFLGLEVTCHQIEGEEKVQWCLSQEAYIKDLLGRYEEEGKPRKLPITRDQASMPPDVIPPSPEGVKFSQKVIGELLWLVTRSRPDLMFGVSRMGANVLKAANCIKDTAAQMRSYLRRTAGEGLQYKQKIDDPITLYVYSDSSFAPEADESHGSFVVMVNDGLMFWRSGRQGTITLSTAESELMELVEAMIAGESVYVVLAELFGEISKVALCDSQAALAILVAEGGSWRTRHLRLRWAFARQSVLRGDWQVGHVPGEKMLADLGTKVLTSSRMETLKQMMGMGVAQPEEKGVEMEKDEKKEKEIKTDSKSVATMAVKLITMAALLSVSKAQGDEEDDEPAGDFHNFMVIYTVLIILTTLMVQILWKVCGPVERPRHLPSAAGSSNQPSPAEDGLGMEEGSPVQLAVAEQRRAGEGGLGQRASVQLPASAGEGGLEGHADPPVQLPAAPAKAPPPKEGPKAPSKAGQTPKAPPKAGPKPKAAPQSGPSASSSSSGSTSSSMTGRIETAIQDIAYEEAALWDHFGRQGDFPGVPEDHSRAELGFQVLRTPCGTVYHDTRGCTQLQGPRTGYARPFTWCALCREVAMRTRGRPIPEVRCFYEWAIRPSILIEDAREH